MGKKSLVILFLVTISLAIFVFATRKTPQYMVHDLDAARAPRASLEEFSIYKYKGHQVVSTLTGKLAQFIDPNVLELYGNLRGLRHDTEKPEYVSAESATVYFSSNGISQLMMGAEVVEAELEDNVNLGVKYNRLFTEFAEYVPKSNLLRSDLPVILKGPSGRFKGDHGFVYDMGQEIVKIFGPIQGEMHGANLPDVK